MNIIYQSDHKIITLIPGFLHCIHDNQESSCPAKVGIGVPERKASMRARASLGLCKGTSWPAPLTVTKVRPLYTWVDPPTC